MRRADNINLILRNKEESDYMSTTKTCESKRSVNITAALITIPSTSTSAVVVGWLSPAEARMTKGAVLGNIHSSLTNAPIAAVSSSTTLPRIC